MIVGITYLNFQSVYCTNLTYGFKIIFFADFLCCLCFNRKEGLPEYTMQDVSKHDSEDKRIWVTYKNGVYDITDFIPKHPGADKIMMAAGGAVEPFWNVYAVHKVC